MLGLGFRARYNERQPGVPRTCAKSNRVTCWKATKCGQASCSLYLGSKGIVQHILLGRFW